MKRHVCAVLMTAALAGCGTGGGGSGPSGPVSDSGNPPSGDSSNPPSGDSSNPPSSDSGNPPAPFQYPTLAAATGAVRAESSIPAGQWGYDSLRGRVSATADGAGNLTFRVDDPRTGPYQFTVNVPPNTTMNFSGAEVSGTFTSFDYSALGTWQRRIDPNSFAFFFGSGVVGVATRAADLPTTGTASYAGPFLGRYNDDGDQWLVSASARSLVNFGTGVASFETTGSQVTDSTGSGGTHPWPGLDLTGSMTFQSSGGARQNSLRGPVSTKPGGLGLTGEARGVFFGPSSPSSAPPELGGSVAARGAPEPGGEGRGLTGGFTMRR